MCKNFFILLIGIAFSANASTKPSECWQKEIDPQTKKIFASKNDWDTAKEDWLSKMPDIVGPISLYRAYSIYRSEKKFALQLKNDKRAHCYIGCRLSQSISFKVAEYVGWLKEQQDIKDCDPNTHFEEADFLATQAGAQIGQSATNAQQCVELCKQSF